MLNSFGIPLVQRWFNLLKKKKSYLAETRFSIVNFRTRFQSHHCKGSLGRCHRPLGRDLTCSTGRWQPRSTMNPHHQTPGGETDPIYPTPRTRQIQHQATKPGCASGPKARQKHGSAMAADYSCSSNKTEKPPSARG